jgi:DNA polymerase-3 subunit gamma/tau
MLDQLVAFCGETITEENVLEIFGFTSREKVAALTSELLSRKTPAALKLIQNEAESGRELSQLLGELIGCLRGLLIAKLDPSADGEGIPEVLWNKLLEDAGDYAPERILAAIDVFAETEGRMKWATNKRLHFELGMIKAIQVLSEVRITDILNVLTKGADHLSAPALASAPAAAAAVAPPAPAPEPVTPKPATVAPTQKKKPGDTMAAFDDLIANAPEGGDEEPTFQAPKPEASPAPQPKAEEKIEEDTFYKDPLIQEALVKFEAKILGT